MMDDQPIFERQWLKKRGQRSNSKKLNFNNVTQLKKHMKLRPQNFCYGDTMVIATLVLG
jgi:hypothetical protein